MRAFVSLSSAKSAFWQSACNERNESADSLHEQRRIGPMAVCGASNAFGIHCTTSAKLAKRQAVCKECNASADSLRYEAKKAKVGLAMQHRPATKLDCVQRNESGCNASC
jgi:hypothetical protein